MRLLKSVYILLVTITLSVNAQTLSAARFHSFCGLLKNKIYCYGGSLIGARNEEIVDSNMFVLDITQSNASTMNDLGNNWKAISPNTAGVIVEKRTYSQTAVIGGTQLLLSGGFGGANSDTALVDQTIVYDAESNSWKKYPNYIEGSFGNRQIYWASTAEVPSKGIAFYGGFESHGRPGWEFPTEQNISATEFNGGRSRAIGYIAVSYLDISNTNNPWSTPPQTNVPSSFSSFQKSVFDSVSNKIFFIGGTYTDTTIPGYVNGKRYWHKMSYALTFDTVSSSWGNQSLSGAILPSDRAYHTTTMLPSAESTMLLYGGERDDIIVSDYCFTLDLKTFTWSQLSIEAKLVDLRRTRHNAVLASNDSLFIVLGTDSISNITSVPIALNISNPASITYIEKYTDPNFALLSSTGSNSTQVPGSTNGDGNSQTGNSNTSANGSPLTTGAIVGISVAGGVLVLILISSIIFYWLIKHKADEINRQAKESDKRNLANVDNGSEVDWDEIEKQFVEVDAPGSISTGKTRAAPDAIDKSKPFAVLSNVPDAQVQRMLPDAQKPS